MWIKETHYRAELKHTIEYQFVCQDCQRPSGPVPREIAAIHDKLYPGHFPPSPQDQAAMPVVMQNKLENVLLSMWIAFEREEYDYYPYRDIGVDRGLNVWKAVCPHCGAKQSWKPKKKLFAKPEPLNPAYLPKINWRWEASNTRLATRIEWVKREKPMWLTDKKYFLSFSDSFFGSPYEIRHTSMNDDENVWRYVVPDLRLEFTKDLMDDEKPLFFIIKPLSFNPELSIPKENRPVFNKGEESYGFVSSQNGNPVVRWAMARDGIVQRTEILPYTK